MRVERSLRSLLVLVSLSGAACGGSPPLQPATPDPAPAGANTPAAGAAEPNATKPASEEEGWAGENAAKNNDAKNG
ncbi:MAG TPA: hypothetical protein VNW92_07805, partial [Polyangiaceae bacterium]|nr:hypothetical protein [Polyangiaceae bacterium]